METHSESATRYGTPVLGSSIAESVAPMPRSRLASPALRALLARRSAERVAWVPLVGLFGLILAPAYIALRFVQVNGVNVPYWDDWRVVMLLTKAFDRTLGWRDIFAPANEHYTAFPYMASLVLAFLTKYNTTAPMFLNVLLIGCTSVVLYLFVRGSVSTAQEALLIFLPVPWLLFSVRQAETLLIEAGLSSFIVNVCAVGAFYGLSKSRGVDRWYLAAFGAGLVASLSFATGLLLWPLGLLQMLLARYRGRTRTAGAARSTSATRIVAWCLVGTCLFGLHYYNYAIGRVGDPIRASSTAVLREHPEQVALYYVTVIGGAFLNDRVPAQALGIVLVALQVIVVGLVVRRPSELGRLSVPLGLMLFSLGCVVMIALGRVGLGIQQAMESRYATITLPGLVGLYLVTALAIHRRRWPIVGSQGLGLLVGLLAFGILAAHIVGEADGARRSEARRMVAYYVRTFDLQSDRNLRAVFPAPVIVRAHAPALRARRMTVFGESTDEPSSLSIAGGSTQSSLDAVNGQIVAIQPVARLNAQTDDTITITGWAVDARTRSPAADVFLVVDDRVVVPAMYGGDRPDVADAFKMPEYRRVGYTASFGIQALGPGRHTIAEHVVGSDGKSVFPNQKRIVVDVN
jgi:hypothetical protein